MIKIGITGSIASGKSSVASLLSKNKKNLFSADEKVRSLYNQQKFQLKLSKKYKLNKGKIKEQIKFKILEKKINIKSLGKFIQPFVRKEMFNFTKKNRNSDILFYEIPLLIESNLMHFFDLIILIVSKKEIRLKRYKKNGGKTKFFNILEKNQLPPKKKYKFCDFVIVNNNTKKMLKEKLDDIIL